MGVKCCSKDAIWLKSVKIKEVTVNFLVCAVCVNGCLADILSYTKRKIYKIKLIKRLWYNPKLNFNSKNIILNGNRLMGQIIHIAPERTFFNVFPLIFLLRIGSLFPTAYSPCGALLTLT